MRPPARLIDGQPGGRRCEEIGMSNVIRISDVVEPKSNGGTILRKNGSKKLYLDFYYHGRRVTKSTGLDDTPANRMKTKRLLDKIIERRDNGTLVFADAFPGASDEEKEYFSTREGWDFKAEPGSVVFGEYLSRWENQILVNYPEGKKRDYREVIKTWLRPYFGNLTFRQINGVELQKFLGILKNKSASRRGNTLSGSRVKNILIPMRVICRDAYEENGWDLPDPFRYLARHIPKRRKHKPVVFRFEEWRRLLDALDVFYRPVAEMMILTGMIASEIAALRPGDIGEKKITVQNSIVRGVEKQELKTAYRNRELPITAAISRRLRISAEANGGKYLFLMPDGSPFDGVHFRRYVWTEALAKAGLDYRVPYTLRHTFAAWSLTVGIHPNKLVKLMGHGSKQMVYEVYGDYVEGLEKDKAAIIEYFGTDYCE